MVPLLVNFVGNAALHLACRRDPPLLAVQTLTSTRPVMVWMTTLDRLLPLHLVCHCGCDVDVAGEILNLIEKMPRPRQERNAGLAGLAGLAVNNNNDINNPFFIRDCYGRTPLHLACTSSCNPHRHPYLIQLLLLQSNNPRKLLMLRE